MQIAVLTSLYPSSVRPREGLFAERRWSAMSRRGHEVRVVQPLPRAPWPAPRLGPWLGRAGWSEIARTPAAERRVGIEITRPRYWHLPGRARGNARRFCRAALPALLAGHGAFGPRPLDAVVADYAWPAGYAAHALRRLGIPCLITGRGSDVTALAGRTALAAELGAALRAAGHWCAVSRDLLGQMDALGGGRGSLVPNGVDAGLFAPRDRREARAALGQAPDQPLILVVGHLIERKDPLLALEAFARGAPPAARLVFLGRGPLAAAIERRARERGCRERVELRGEVEPEALARWYAAADCLLLTSAREGRPNVVLEAFASGRPALCTEAGGTAELLAELPECLVRSRDPAEIGARLALLLARPPEPGRLRATVLPLTWERCAEALEACLSAALERGKPAAP
jgi:glycosyltransferase involved in cell wall biosynthesis